MKSFNEYPVSAELASRTLAAAREARRKRRSITGAVSSMILVTALAAGALFLPGQLRQAGTAQATQPALAAATSAPLPTSESIIPSQTQAEAKLNSAVVPLVGEGGDPAAWDYSKIHEDGSLNILIEPGKLGETLAKYGLRLNTDTAADIQNSLTKDGEELRLVLVSVNSGSLKLSPVGLYKVGGTVQFRFTDGKPDLYDASTDDMGRRAFLVEVPKDASGLPFESGSVPWQDIGREKQLEILLERIMTSEKAAHELATAKPDGKAIPEVFLSMSPKETEAIIAMGQDADAWLNDRHASLQSPNAGLQYELKVVELLIKKIKDRLNPPDPYVTLRDALLQQRSYDSIQSALASDLATRILAENGADAGDDRVQACALFPIKEPLDDNKIIAAVLASVVGKDGKPSAPALFVVDADYEQTGSESAPAWKLKSWDIYKKDRLDQEEYPMLKYRGGDKELNSLYASLNGILKDYVDAPFTLPLDNTGGANIKLLDSFGILRWCRLSLWVRREANAGVDNIDIDAVDFPAVGSLAEKINALSGGVWRSHSESDYTKEIKPNDKAGLQSVMLELHTVNEEGLWVYNFQFIPSEKMTVLWRYLTKADGTAGRSEWFCNREDRIYNSVLTALNVNLDVSALLIDNTPKFTLPKDREELKYLVALVQDMPGGVAAIHPSILYNNGTGGYTTRKMPDIKTKSKVVAWATGLNSLLGSEAMSSKETVKQIDAMPDNMYAAGEAEQPALLKWDLDVAAQEGAATLIIYANPVTKQVWAETTYRLYGSTNMNTRYMATAEGDDALYLLLTKLTFGKEYRDVEDVPKAD